MAAGEESKECGAADDAAAADVDAVDVLLFLSL